MGYQEAIKIANANANAVGDIVCEVIEFNDRFVISYEDRDGNVPDVSPIFVLKESGDVGTFSHLTMMEIFLNQVKQCLQNNILPKIYGEL